MKNKFAIFFGVKNVTIQQNIVAFFVTAHLTNTIFRLKLDLDKGLAEKKEALNELYITPYGK